MLGRVWDGLTKPNDVRRPMSSFVVWLGCHVAAGDVAPRLRSWAAVCIRRRSFRFMGSRWHPWAVGFVIARPWRGGCVVVVVGGVVVWWLWWLMAERTDVTRRDISVMFKLTQKIT